MSANLKKNKTEKLKESWAYNNYDPNNIITNAVLYAHNYTLNRHAGVIKRGLYKTKTGFKPINNI